jgi:hypothetical protein
MLAHTCCDYVKGKIITYNDVLNISSFLCVACHFESKKEEEYADTQFARYFP